MFTAPTMTRPPCLVLVHNHRFDANLPVLDRLYGERFSRIVHLVPFYTGDRPNVVPVYGSSHQFQGYVAQGLRAVLGEGHEHYIFLGDDVLLNPVVNEANYRDHFGVGPDTGFLPDFIRLHQLDTHWRRIPEALDLRVRQAGVEVVKELPTPEEAERLLAAHGLATAPIPDRFARGPFPGLSGPAGGTMPALRWLKGWITAPRGGHRLSYPLVGSYSDIFVVPASTVQRFAHYCGVFAALRLFAELAIPTALALSTKTIRTERDTALKGKALWNAEDLALLAPYAHDLDALLTGFPEGLLYLHPVKLSKWRRREA